jgi:hypothetical protein
VFDVRLDEKRRHFYMSFAELGTWWFPYGSYTGYNVYSWKEPLRPEHAVWLNFYSRTSLNGVLQMAEPGVAQIR